MDRTKAPKIHPMGELRLPELHTERLSNGVVLHTLSGGTQDVNQLNLVWPGGRDEARTPAIAMLAAQLLREGAGAMSGAELSEAIDFRGAMLRCDAGDHHTFVTMSSVNSLSDGVLPLLRAMIEEPRYEQHAFEIYREKEAKEIQLLMSKVSHLSQQGINRLIMGQDNPLARAETPEAVMAVTRDEVAAFHRRVYTASGCQAFLSGKISDRLYHEVREMLESLPAQSPAMALSLHPYHAEPPQEVVTSKYGALQNSVRMAFPAPPRTSPDYIPLRFATIALGGYFGSRLMKNIREDKGYTYGIHAYLLGGIDGSYVSIEAETDPAYVRAVIDETRAELRRLASEPMGEDEQRRLSQFVGAALMDILDSPMSTMDYYKGMIAANMPKGYFARQVEFVRHLDPAKIMEMTARYMDPEQMRIAIAGRIEP